MKADPAVDDWSLLVQNNLTEMNLKYSDKDIRNMVPSVYKKVIKETVRAQSFIYFTELQANHKKSRNITHNEH